MIDHADRQTLRELARQIADIAAMSIQTERTMLWRGHNALKPHRPMILIFPEGSWRELLPEQSLVCRDKEARQIEQSLRQRLYYHQHLHDDTVIEKSWMVGTVFHSTGWGLEKRQIASDAAHGAWSFDPVIHHPRDLEQLQVPRISVDHQATAAKLARMQELFGDLLDVTPCGVAHIGYHLMAHYTGLRGLEQVMMDMLDEPQWLHDAMSFLCHGYQSILQQYIELNLLALNNDGTYHSSGGNGYNDSELPAAGFDPARVRPCDMWASAESQELTQVSPAMHEAFALNYEKTLLEPFGLTGYGCCDDLTAKLPMVMAIPNMRRISISPFANVDRCAEQLQDRFIFSWKPNPARLVGRFDEEVIRQEIRHTLQVAAENGCVLEMILKDTHTCDDQPWRFEQWARIAREEVDASLQVAAR